MTPRILELAYRDLEDGKSFYDRQQPGVGDYFVRAILLDVRSLSKLAGIHPKSYGFHRMLARRFPFGLYYLIEGGEAHVYAILDLRREPSWIHDELTDRSS